MSNAGLRLRTERNRLCISRQHAQLDELYAHVAEALERRGIHTARERFERFTDALEAHLSLEESIHFPAVEALQPALGPDLGVLRKAHRGLRRDVQAIRLLLASGDSMSARERLARFIEQLSQHESQEESLLACAPEPGDASHPEAAIDIGASQRRRMQ